MFKRGLLCVIALLVLAGASECSADEFRAFWVDAFHVGAKSAADIDALLSTVRNSNMNAVVVQIRKRGNTYYPSNYDPWAPDADTSFDALQYLIDSAHNSNPRIEVHAWFCMLPIWNSQTTAPTASNHVYNMHPNWLTQDINGVKWDGSNYCLDPGVPAASQYTCDVLMDVVNRYDVDGIHYDYVRYAGDTWGYNPVAVNRFNTIYGRTGTPNTIDEDWSQFRRDQVTALVRKLYLNTIAIKPNIKMSAATITWGNGPTSDTAWFSSSAYSGVMQDWRSWMEEGILDINMPMTYYREYQYPTYYDNWIEFEKNHKYSRQLAVGPAVYLNSIQDSITQFRETRTPGANGQAADGLVMYSYAVTNDQNKDDLVTGGDPTYDPDVPNSEFYNAIAHPSSYDTNPTPLFNTWVPTPDMPWKSAPNQGNIKGIVTDCNGNWVDGAAVTLVGAGKSQVTDGTGFYGFVGLTPGTYTVSVSNPAKPTMQAAVTVTAGQVSNADFSLCAPVPVISNVRAENMGMYSADIKWDTDIPGSSQVDYGLTTSYGSTTSLDSNYVQNHSFSLSGLDPGKTYHYRVRSWSMGGPEAVSGDYAFTTTNDTTPPVISNVTVVSISSNEAYITWNTDDPATSQAEYGTSSSYGFATAEDTSKVTAHGIFITGLNGNTTYHFRVKSANGAGLTSYSSDGTFATRPAPEIIIDDPQASYTGTWTPVTGTGGWPTTASQWKNIKNTKTTESGSCKWTPNITTAGKYDVYCWYSASTSNTIKAPYTITYSGGSVTSIISQQISGSQWVKLTAASGPLQFNSGTAGNVVLSNKTGETSGNKNVIADAVRFAYVDIDDMPPAVPQNLQVTAISTSQINLAWSPSPDNVATIGYKIFRDGVQAGTTAATSYTDAGLTTNLRYYYSVSAYDARNNESAQCAAISRYTLAKAPTAQDITCNKNTQTWMNNPLFTFTNGIFGTGGVGYYKYIWDNEPTYAWTNGEATWAAGTQDVTADSSSANWYFHVRSYNYEGVASGSLDLGPYYYDGAAPVISSVTNQWYIKKNPLDSLFAKWEGSDPASGIAEYQYAIGTTSGGTDICNWTSNALAESATYSFASLPTGDKDYYWSIKARDNAGNWSEPLSSHWQTYADSFDTIAAAMANPDNTPVIISTYKQVSANFGGFLYAQEPDRSRGIRFDYSNPAWTAGNIVTFGAHLGTLSNERTFTDVESKNWGMGDSSWVKPLAIRISSVGGSAPDAYTHGIAGELGLYNLGLLVRVVGQVRTKGAGYFDLNDGSGPNIRVYSDYIPADNAILGVTGISGIDTQGSRMIRATGQPREY